MNEQRPIDKTGRPIYAGDLLRSPHFIGARRKRFYIYHVAVTNKNGTLDMVPPSHLEPSKISGGGRCLLSERLASMCEIIHGYGPGRGMSFEDRRKVKQKEAKP